MKKTLIAMALAMGFVAPAVAEPNENEMRARLITSVLSEAVPNVKVVGVKESPLPGLFEVELTGGIVYATADAKHILQGDLLAINGREVTNLTDKSLSVKRVKEINAFPKKHMITYKAKGKEKAAVTIFTDVDCGFCRKQHLELTELNKAGVTVNYVPYPRGGMESQTAGKMHDVWCASDRKTAITAVKTDQPAVSAKPKCKSPVKDGFELGQRIGVTGTPAIYDKTGKYIGGYLTAEQMLVALGMKGK